MSDAEDNKSWHRYRDAVRATNQLMQQDRKQEGLRLLGDAITVAQRENERRWVLTLSHHAAVISNFLGNLKLEKRYYQQSLSFNPENPRALLGLANVSEEQGEPELAKSYAARCYKALTDGDDFLKDSLLERLLNKWPEVLPPSMRGPV